MKKLIISLLAALTVFSTAVLGGCLNVSGADGKDGRDGKNATAYEYYELAKSENPDLTIEEFLREYLSFDYDDLDGSFSLQASINRSLFSGVSIVSIFDVYETKYPYGQTRKQVYGLGSGAVIELGKDGDGLTGDAYIVTNCHVIYDDTAIEHISQSVYVYLYGMDDDYNDRNYAIPATVVGASRDYDIALLKVEDSEVIRESTVLEASFSDNDDVYIGETVYSVGNPAGCGLSATHGIISKESEYITIDMSSSNYVSDERDYRVLRTDAAINGGNSGGGLFNLSGEIVGIVNAKSASEDIDNMGYALPASFAKRLVKLMRENTETFNPNGEPGISHAMLNAVYTADNRNVALVDGLAVISETVKATTAGDGLEKDDVIKHITVADASGNVVEDREVTRIYHVDDLLISARVGYTVTLTVSRGGKDVAVPVAITSNHFVNFE